MTTRIPETTRVPKNSEKTVQNSDFDAVSMDCQMPVMDGYDATRNIRKLGPQYLEHPIIAVTAHALKGDRSKCLDAGMDDLSKPISGKELFQTLMQWMKSPAHA